MDYNVDADRKRRDAYLDIEHAAVKRSSLAWTAVEYIDSFTRKLYLYLIVRNRMVPPNKQVFIGLATEGFADLLSDEYLASTRRNRSAQIVERRRVKEILHSKGIKALTKTFSKEKSEIYMQRAMAQSTETTSPQNAEMEES